MDRETWFGVELRHLAALAAVAREGSFRGAADSLGYVQSAVSQQVANLEGVVGVRLVERCRGSKQVHLTDAGELLVSHAEDILARVHAARADLTVHLDGEDAMRLRLGVCEHTSGSRLLVEMLRRVADTAPDLDVEPVEAGDDDALVELLERGTVDVVLGDLALDPSSFDSGGILSDSCSLLVRSDADWARDLAPKDAAEVASLPLVALDGWRFLSSVETWFASEGLVPTFVRRARSGAAVRALVGAGVGAAIVPTLSADELAQSADGADHWIKAVELRGLLPTRRVGLHWHTARREQAGLAELLEAATRVGRRVSDRRLARRTVDRPLRESDRSDGVALVAA